MLNLTKDEVEALRNVLILLRKKTGTSIAEDADVDPKEIDAFTTPRGKGTNAFRRVKPSDGFATRALNFLFSKHAIDKIQYAESHGLANEVKILRKYMSNNAQLPDLDIAFNYFSSVNQFVTARECKTICETFSGDYDIFRLTSDSQGVGKINHSLLTIKRYSPYNKLPYFKNMFRIDGDTGKVTRIVEGHIIKISAHHPIYMFLGNSVADSRERPKRFAGSKVMILRLISHSGDKTRFMGFFYTSGHQEIYDVGATRIHRRDTITNLDYPYSNNEKVADENTLEKALEDMECVVDLDSTSEDSLRSTAKNFIPFALPDLALEVSDKIIFNERIYASLAFNMAKPSRRA